MKLIITLVALVTLAAAAPAGAQDPSPPRETAPTSKKQIIAEMVTAGMLAARAGVPRPFQSRLGTGGRGEIVAYMVAIHRDRKGYEALLQALEARAAKQVGSSSTSAGTTSVAMKGLAPEILGVAVENGAISREVSGTALTFRATPLGVAKALQNKGLVTIYDDYAASDFQKYAARLSLAASFDITKGPSAGAFAADEHQLTNWSVRYVLLNQRDPASQGYADRWTGLVRGSSAYTATAVAIDKQLSQWTDYTTWERSVLSRTEKLVEAPLSLDKDVEAAGKRFAALLETEMPKLDNLSNFPTPVLKALDEYVAQLTTVQGTIDEIYEFAGKGSLLTLDWSTTRDANVPDLYTTTAIWEYALGTTRQTSLTVNGAFSFYRERPNADTRQFKSFELTGQLDHPLGGSIVFPKATLTVAGRLAHLPNDTLAAAPGAAATPTGNATIPTTAPKGTIGLIQLKVTVPVKGTAVKIPLSITASNRTELIKEKDIRASFGITYDLDSLLSGLLNRR